jgi:leucyl-tRNA synthetase
MFMGDYRLGGDWDDTGIQGMYRFLNRLWRLVHFNSERVGEIKPTVTTAANLNALGTRERQIAGVMNNSIKGVTEDLERLHFNTALSRIMELVNELVPYAGDESGNKDINFHFLAEALDNLVLLMAPFAPHLVEELWQDALRHDKSVFLNQWPSYDPDILIKDEITVVIQINGKLRSQIQAARDLPEEKIVAQARLDNKTASYLEGKNIRRVVYVPNKLVNFVI